MHSVQRSREPDFFVAIRAANTQWDDLDGSNRRRIRHALAQEFGRICAYCEQFCQLPTPAGNPNEESVDHFRPRSRFPDQWLDWLNLVYSCRRCNQSKADSWPGYDDALTNRLLAAEDSRYTPISEYVNPNADAARRPANEFFDFNIATGEIAPAERLDPVEWSIARRTVADINLNDSDRGENEPGHLPYLRRSQLGLLIYELDRLDDFDSKVQLMLEFILPDKPFSGFVTAYLISRIPALGQLLHRP